MKKIFVVKIWAILLLTTTACSANTFDYYKEDFEELVQDPKDRKFKENENDVSDLRGCKMLIDQYWSYEERWNSWSTRQEWLEKTLHTHTGVGLVEENEGTPNILKSEGKKIFQLGGRDVADQKDGEKQFNNKTKFYGYTAQHLIYIGPWKKVMMRYQTKLWEKQKTEEKEIRFYAYQYFGSQVIGGGNIAESGGIQYAYEEATKENRLILEKPFKLSPNVKIAPSRFELCAVKWTARFGYNAIAEVKSKNPFSKNYLVPTGRVIDSETGKIIEAKE